jgi:chloramphenicol-sensitive protein RarD
MLPLLTVLVGKLAFNETLGAAQRIAICLAILAVLIQLLAHGSLPWISLVVSISFALYGAIRKKIEADSMQGLFIETLCMAPFALTWLWMTDGAGLGQHGLRVDIFLLLGGIYTTAPLLTYIAATRLLPLKIVGLTSYLGPSLQLLVAQTLLGETIDAVMAASFGLVWVGVLLASGQGLLRLQRRPLPGH